MLPYAFGGPACAATFKEQPNDFIVSERLPFEADGEGPHWLVQIEKTDLNTLDMLDALARRFKISRRNIGYSGLKDRFAVTRQFVTVPANDVSVQELEGAYDTHWKVLEVSAHRRKLRVGSHRRNAFSITLGNISQSDNVRDALVQRLENIACNGAPNYFGPQRFGNDGANLRKARQLFEGTRKLPRQQHRFAVSAARSFVFNAVLACRVEDGSWNRLIEGEAVSLDGSSSWFDYARLDENTETRLAQFDIHPSGPLWGSGVPPVSSEAADLEKAAVGPLTLFTNGLEELGLKHERRALRQRVSEFKWTFDETDLVLEFTLAKGGFATSVLRELVAHPALDLKNA